VATGEQADQHLLDDFVLADNDLRDGSRSSLMAMSASEAGSGVATGKSFMRTLGDVSIVRQGARTAGSRVQPQAVSA
jgi:hypothetical protein